jgi:hypothetical protein
VVLVWTCVISSAIDCIVQRKFEVVKTILSFVTFTAPVGSTNWLSGYVKENVRLERG